MRSTIRVLQAADFLLHQPLDTAGVLPTTFREFFNQARERATLKVINQAIQSTVDVLLVTGQLVQFEEEPRLACFLQEQFRRLHAQGVQIVWAAHNQGNLPAWSINSFVTHLQAGESKMLSLPESSGNRILIRWENDSASASSASSSADLTISIQNQVNSLAIEYSGAGIAQPVRHRTASIQPTGPEDNSTCGMWLIEANQHNHIKSTLLPTTVVNWVTEEITIQAETLRGDLLNEMQRRVSDLSRRQTTELTLVKWRLTGEGSLWDHIAEDVDGHGLLQDSRDCIEASQRIWCWKIELAPATAQLETWQNRSQAFALAFKEYEDLTAGDLTAASGAGLLPGYTGSRFHAHLIPANTIRLQVAKSLNQTDSAPIADAG
ncbi:hypothetical protein [Planctomicrobium sp. SH527]|uniref:hypothetical protein n=1 Tax=Planctomicrobium sp. SH527 TaxID=3448123 RepID=UPI003F5B396F